MEAQYTLSTDPQQRREVKERLLTCFSVLRERRLADTYDDIARAMGMNPVTVRSAFAPSNSYLSDRFLRQFLSTYPGLFSSEWLYTGEGEISKDEGRQAPYLTERWERVQMIMEREGLTHITMSEKIGLKNYSTLYRVVRQHKKPQDATLNKILECYPKYRREWLLQGKGAPTEEEMKDQPYLDALNNRYPSTAMPFKFDDVMSFPVVREPAFAGSTTGYGDETHDELSKVVLPVDRTYRGEYQVFSVQGASMDDGTLMSLADGDLVLARKVDRKYWLDGLHTRKWLYFIFVTQDDGILIKSVERQDNEKGLFYLHSLNPDYPDLTLDMRDVVEIYNVIQVIQRRLTY